MEQRPQIRHFNDIRPSRQGQPSAGPSTPAEPAGPKAPKPSAPAPVRESAPAPEPAPQPVAPVSPAATTSQRGRFWPAFWRFLLLLIILGAIVAGGLYLYLNFYHHA